MRVRVKSNPYVSLGGALAVAGLLLMAAGLFGTAFGLPLAMVGNSKCQLVHAYIDPETPAYAQATIFKIKLSGTEHPLWVNFTEPNGQWHYSSGGQSWDDPSVWEFERTFTFYPYSSGEVKYAFGYVGSDNAKVQTGSGSIKFTLSGAQVTKIGIGSLRHTGSAAPGAQVEVGYTLGMTSNVPVSGAFCRVVDAGTGTVIAQHDFGDFPAGNRTIDRFTSNTFRFPMRSDGYDYRLRIEAGANGQVLDSMGFTVKGTGGSGGSQEGGGGDGGTPIAPEASPDYAVVALGAITSGLGLLVAALSPRGRR